MRRWIAHVPLIAALAGGCGSGHPAPSAVPGMVDRTAAVPAAPDPIPEPSGSDVRDTAARANAFAARLHRRLAAKGGNLFWSPSSVSAALAMALLGARGATAAEMRTVLSATETSGFAAHLGTTQRWLGGGSAAPNTLQIANALWGADGAEFAPDYLAAVKRSYGSGINTLDFTQPEAARGVINAWAKVNTNGCIPTLIPPGVLDSRTRAVLADAIYFKGTWKTEFDPAKTYSAAFHREGAAPVNVRMMTQHTKLRSASEGNVALALLPYRPPAAGPRGARCAMLIALPTGDTLLHAVEQQLTGRRIQRWLATVTKPHPRTLRLYLPRFRARSSLRLDPALAAMGMTAAFSAGRADFTGMLPKEPDVYIGAVLHQAFVEVNEEGTEAAAATAVVMKAKGGPPREFRCNRPFLYFIVELHSGTVLFMGRCADPSVPDGA